jgi:hypothetical protein
LSHFSSNTPVVIFVVENPNGSLELLARSTDAGEFTIPAMSCVGKQIRENPTQVKWNAGRLSTCGSLSMSPRPYLAARNEKATT